MYAAAVELAVTVFVSTVPAVVLPLPTKLTDSFNAIASEYVPLPRKTDCVPSLSEAAIAAATVLYSTAVPFCKDVVVPKTAIPG